MTHSDIAANDLADKIVQIMIRHCGMDSVHWQNTNVKDDLRRDTRRLANAIKKDLTNEV